MIGRSHMPGKRARPGGTGGPIPGHDGTATGHQHALSADMPKVMARLLYRRDQWGLEYAGDTPACSPAVAPAADAERYRALYGSLLARAWERANESALWDPPANDDETLREALGAAVGAPDAEAIRQWMSARGQEFLSTVNRGLPHDPLWRVAEVLRDSGLPPTLRVVVLPVAGPWLEVGSGIARVSLSLYADTDRFASLVRESLTAP